MRLRILTYNIHKGFDWNKKNYFLEEIKNLVQASNADIVFLQEVVGDNSQYKKKGLIDSQFEYIADSVWSHYSYAKNAVYDNGHHGNLILSQFPILFWNNTNISTNIFEKRGILFCQISIPNQKNSIYVFCVHLDIFNKGRNLQYLMIKNYIASLNIPSDAPIIIAGDFNDWNMQATASFENDLQMSEVHKHLHGVFAKTFPAAFPILSLDRIYVKNLLVKSSKVLPNLEKNHFSDHLPLLCEVECCET